VNELKYLVLDASTLISLAGSCLFYALKDFRAKAGIQPVISAAVEGESVSRPLGIKRFELSAVRIRHAIEEANIKVVDLSSKSLGLCSEIEEKANSIFYSKHGNVTLLQRGEIESIALLKQLGSELFAVDERNTIMLFESPLRLRKLIERRQHCKIQYYKDNLDAFREILPKATIVRSSELAAFAFNEGFLSGELGTGKKALEGALYALKFMGCAVSIREIDNYVRGHK